MKMCTFLFFFNDAATTEIYTFPYTTLFRSYSKASAFRSKARRHRKACKKQSIRWSSTRSEEHTSELQSLAYLVCRLLLEKKKKKTCRMLTLSITHCLETVLLSAC